MHIGFIEDTPLHGGTQIWVTEAIRAFIKLGHEITLLAPQQSWIVEQCRQTDAHLATYDWDEVVHQDTHHQAIWTDALKDCDVAICTVHPPRENFHCSVFGAICIREGNLNTYLIPKTGTIVPDYLRKFYLPDESIRSSVITIADFTRRYLIEVYNIPPEKVALIYQGTDVQRFRHAESTRREAQSRYPLPPHASPILGSIGSLEARKGHLILLEALKSLVVGALPDAHLMLVGDGPDEYKLKEMVRTLGLENHVSFFPFTSEPNFVYERIDITVLPSLYKEGLPNVLLESMSMGVPVVASNLGGVPEVVIDGKTGYVIEPGNKQAFADGIEKLWGDQRNYQKIQKNVRKFIDSAFNKTKQFDNFVSHFQKLISS